MPGLVKKIPANDLTEIRSSIELEDSNSETSQDTRTWEKLTQNLEHRLANDAGESEPEKLQADSAIHPKSSTHLGCHEAFVLQGSACIENASK